MKLKINQLENPLTGNPVANHYEIETDKYYIFQSYKTIICQIDRQSPFNVVLDPKWNYSKTTLKYLKQFLKMNLSKNDILAKIERGDYIIKNLNR